MPGMAPPSHADKRAVAPEPNGRPRWVVVLGWFAGVFGVATVFSGGAVLFVGGPVPAMAGNSVPFVVVFNFVAGFAYLTAAAGLLRGKPWTLPLSATIAALTILVFVAFGVHVLAGEPFEVRTVGAMTLRSALWVGITLALHIKRHP